jgi:hypothetical protein
MNKLLVLAAFAALTAYPAAACDWNREASTQDQVVATAADQTPQAAPACSGPNCTVPQPDGAPSEQVARKDVFEPAPILMVTDRH